MMIDWRYELDKRREKFWLGLARLVPRKLAFWVYIVQGARYMGNDVVPEVTYVELLERMAK